MDPLTVGMLLVGVLFVLILVGFHVGVALMSLSAIGVYLITGRFNVAASLLKSTAYNSIADYVYAVIPLFVLMGLLTTASGATRDLFNAAEVIFRRLRGGVGIATVGANGVFAAITGVSVASVVVFSKIAAPEMERLNYQRRFSLGIIASSSLLGMMIPPSVLMIVYGILAEQSIGRLFIGGIVPGLGIILILSLTIMILVKIRPELAPKIPTLPSKRGDIRRTLLGPWHLYALIFVILGGIYGGVFTPTEAGAVGAAGALLIVVIRGQASMAGMLDVILETGKSTASIFFLFMAAAMYSRMLTLSGLPVELSGWAAAAPVPPIAIVLLFVFVILLFGMILDSISILLLTMPIMVPVIQALGYDAIWFGIVSIFAIEMGLITPPFGMAVFAMKAALPFDVDLGEIYKGAAPFLLALFVLLVALIFVPGLVLWLPATVF